jgi:hypothetical protein
MTRHINIFLFLFALSFIFSCKEKENPKIERNYLKSEINKIVNKEINTNSDYTIWYSSEKNNNQYKNIKIYISNDSIKVVNENKTICKGEIVKEKLTFTDYFKSEKTGIEIREKLINEYRLNVKDSLIAVMNAYGDISDKGCLFPFSDMFIIDNHLFFYNKEYQCFTLNKNVTQTSEVNIENSEVTLPYNKIININNVKYFKVNKNAIKGLDDFSCDEDQVRYITLPSKDGINLILVPQDCADFPYRFYLLSIKNNEVISNLYVEGEWFEPENFEDKEIKSFKISKDFKIQVNTLTNKKGKQIENYEITDKGFFKKT